MAQSNLAIPSLVLVDTWQWSPMIALILRSVDALKTFDIIYLITEGGPGAASETLNVLAFKTGFQFFHAGYAATLLILLMFLVLGIAVLLNQIRRRV